MMGWYAGLAGWRAAIVPGALLAQALCLPGLKDDQQDRVAEIAHFLYLGMKPTDGLREAFEKCADLTAAVTCRSRP